MPDLRGDWAEGVYQPLQYVIQSQPDLLPDEYVEAYEGPRGVYCQNPSAEMQCQLSCSKTHC